MYWFYRCGSHPNLTFSGKLTGGSGNDTLVSIELSASSKDYFLSVWFLNEYSDKKVLFEEKLTGTGVDYHSSNHNPNCYMLSSIDGEIPNLVHSIRTNTFNELHYRKFIRVLLEFLEVPEIEKNHLFELLTHVRWFEH